MKVTIISDHNPIRVTISIPKPEPVRKQITYRKIKDIDINSLQEDILKSSLINKPSDNIDSFVNQYNETLSAILNEHAPVIDKTVTVHPNAPWFSEDISQAKRKRRCAERRWCSNKTQINLEMLRESRVEVNTLCRKAKCQYYQTKIEECGNDKNALFKLTDSLLCKKQEVKLPETEDNS